MFFLPHGCHGETHGFRGRRPASGQRNRPGAAQRLLGDSGNTAPGSWGNPKPWDSHGKTWENDRNTWEKEKRIGQKLGNHVNMSIILGEWCENHEHRFAFRGFCGMAVFVASISPGGTCWAPAAREAKSGAPPGKGGRWSFSRVFQCSDFKGWERTGRWGCCDAENSLRTGFLHGSSP